MVAGLATAGSDMRLVPALLPASSAARALFVPLVWHAPAVCSSQTVAHISSRSCQRLCLLLKWSARGHFQISVLQRPPLANNFSTWALGSLIPVETEKARRALEGFVATFSKAVAPRFLPRLHATQPEAWVRISSTLAMSAMGFATSSASAEDPSGTSGGAWSSGQGQNHNGTNSDSFGDGGDAAVATQEHVTDFDIRVKSEEAQSSSSSSKGANPNLALVVLNYKLPPFTPSLWRQAGRFRICADGGANRLFDEIPKLFPNENPEDVRLRFVPDVIKGDLDSIRPEVADFYAAQGTRVINLSEDQDSTDLHKSLSCIINSFPDASTGQLKILVVGALGGRLDHEFGNFNVLFMFRQLSIVLLSTHSLAFLLTPKVRHVIRVNRDWQGPACGLIPLGAAAEWTQTTGLRWNLEGRRMEFGGLVSTSNIVDSDTVTVESDGCLLWTLEIKKAAL